MSRLKAHNGGVIHQAVLVGAGLGLLVPLVAGVGAIDKLGEGGLTVVAAYGGMLGLSIGSVVGLMLGITVRLALLCDGWWRKTFRRGATQISS
ncbi:MAG TPA: hypothetical protein VFW33_17735 [Gemmataceae bacterium]|nr:hypothetical protein [Gemmataceae bacterium]